MTTRNHTPVATGAAANASVINAPLGQLDATLGDLTALTTTAKTDLVVAINELDSVKQDAATAQAINLVNASPASGSAGVPGYRALVTNDLPASGVSAGTYAKVVVDAKGRVTSGSAQIGTADISDIASYPLDTLGAATDNTNKDASITAHGLLPKLANDVTKVLTGLGTWVKWAMGVKYNSSGAYTPRAFINFLGAGVSVTDDAANDCVKVTISGIAGGTQALDMLTDCELTSPVNNNVLTYDQSTALWKNQNISSFVPTGHVVQEEGANLTNRPNLNFIGAGVTAADNSGTNATDVTVAAASLTATGTVELATVAETTAGNDAGRAVTPDGLAGSVYGQFVVQVALNGSTALTTSDKGYFRIPAKINGWNLVAVAAMVKGASSSGVPTFTIKKGATAMLSTALTIDATEYDSSTATAAVIDTAQDDVATGTQIEVAVTTAGTGTTYAVVELTFQAP